MNGIDVESIVRAAIETQVAEIKKRIIEVAVEDFRQQVRGAVGNVAIKLSELYSIQRLGTELVIHVELEHTSGR